MSLKEEIDVCSLSSTIYTYPFPEQLKNISLANFTASSIELFASKNVNIIRLMLTSSFELHFFFIYVLTTFWNILRLSQFILPEGSLDYN